MKSATRVIISELRVPTLQAARENFPSGKFIIPIILTSHEAAWFTWCLSHLSETLNQRDGLWEKQEQNQLTEDNRVNSNIL